MDTVNVLVRVFSCNAPAVRWLRRCTERASLQSVSQGDTYRSVSAQSDLNSVRRARAVFRSDVAGLSLFRCAVWVDKTQAPAPISEVRNPHPEMRNCFAGRQTATGEGYSAKDLARYSLPHEQTRTPVRCAIAPSLECHAHGSTATCAASLCMPRGSIEKTHRLWAVELKTCLSRGLVPVILDKKLLKEPS
jgi:hypothetical protein